ncbi:CIA30 family protein [Pseudoalteromonas sp. G4]|uniref:CIA30 family protein n=1 Tax=Pseudoalteromonas sp. G4 TaxID=2992761 RepID=UPI00237DE23D|nr:CIA30 family protein [Pseudoalteromonas sp. G4]MDE3272309.1 CIA30 family protein [Pseudoalteromonas sp. G4]
MKSSLATGLLLIAANANANINLNQLEWMVINDSVMGGVSNSRVIVGDNNLTFKGKVSLANNGGFASFRAPISFENTNIDSLSLKVVGDGKQYQLRLRVDGYYDGPAFVYHFKTEVGKEHTFNLSEQDFVLMFRGRQFASDYQLRFDDVRSLGFMISGKQSGNFNLQVKQIKLQYKV